MQYFYGRASFFSSSLTSARELVRQSLDCRQRLLVKFSLLVLQLIVHRALHVSVPGRLLLIPGLLLLAQAVCTAFQPVLPLIQGMLPLQQVLVSSLEVAKARCHLQDNRSMHTDTALLLHASLLAVKT